MRSDMTWVSNTENMVKKANKRLWIVRRLKQLGAQQDDLIDLYIKQIRSVLELAVPAWHGDITQVERMDIERIQKSAAHIILGERYISYRQALKTLNLQSLQSRRDKLCLKHTKFQKWFKPAHYSQDTRQEKFKYCKVQAKHNRFEKSPLCFLTKMLNAYHNRQ